MTVILPATAERAARAQRLHDLAEGGWWCKQCARDGHGHIAAGMCEIYLWADDVLAAFRRQQARLNRPPARGRARVGARYWSRS